MVSMPGWVWRVGGSLVDLVGGLWGWWLVENFGPGVGLVVGRETVAVGGLGCVSGALACMVECLIEKFWMV